MKFKNIHILFVYYFAKKKKKKILVCSEDNYRFYNMHNSGLFEFEK